jgi:hypothetical protein
MKTYTGGCHCGKFKYEADTDLEKVIECNCSHCHKKGLILNFVQPEQFRLVEGDESELTDYQFNKKMIHHLTCPVCGVQSFAWGTTKDGNKMYSLNVRCLEGVELSEITLTPFNGREY